MLPQNRKQHEIKGDGNCLFRCFSYYIFENQDEHLRIRHQLTQLIKENPTEFNEQLTQSVEDHVNHMKQDKSWGTNAEIKAAAYLFKIPVFVATKKDNDYYWVKFQKSDSLPTLSEAPEQIKVPKNICHMEVIHLNDDHYNVVVTSNGIPSKSMPYEGDKSSNFNDVVPVSS